MRYAAFMRALNVGGRVVKMEELKRVFVKAGFTNVESFIASGNIVFESRSPDAAALERKISASLEKALGYEVVTFVRTMDELAEIAARNPFKGIEDGRVYLVGFFAAPLPAAAVKTLMSLAPKDDRFHVRGREFWWYSETGQGRNDFSNNVLEKKVGVRTTFRNVRTLRKMLAQFGD